MDPTIIPILNAQQQGISPWVNEVNVLPEMAQANAQNLALQMLRQQKEQVQAPEESRQSSQISDKEKGNGGARQELSPRKRKPPNEEAAEDAASPRPSENPLVGNLLNVCT